MKIKEVEARVGMTRANIRYYEKEGLLNTTIRNENNYREYTEEDVEQLQKIKILRLLGVAPADIKLLNADAISMEEIMKKRVEELEREAKQIQDIHRICETIIDKKIDVHSLNENVLTGDKAVWMKRMEELLRMDIVEEVIVKKQLNKTMAVMLSWGYLLTAFVTMCICSIGRSSEAFAFLFERENDSNTFWWIGAALVVSFLAIHYSANVVLHLISFHISTLLLAPFFMVAAGILGAMFFDGTPLAEISLFQMTGFWLMIVLYVAILYLLSGRWNRLFTKVKYALIVAAVYSIVAAVVIWLTCAQWKVTAVALAFFAFTIAVKWTIAVLDRKTYNRYYAVRHAGSIMNIIGLNVWSVGYDNKS